MPMRTGRPDIPILAARVQWDCPHCGVTDVTNEARPHTRFHTCTGLGGLTAPLIQVAANRGNVNVRKVVREDYVGKEKGLTYDSDGKPIMAIVTEYDDGKTDAAVYPGVARMDIRKV